MTRHGTAMLAALVAAGPAAGAEAVFKAPAWGLTIRYPSDLAVAPAFKSNAFTDGAWRMSYAAGPGDGTPIVAFSLPDLHARDAGGTTLATLELTIGASRSAASVASCLDYGMNSGDNVTIKTRTVGGTIFTEVPDNADGGLRDRVQSDDLRAVRDGTCWAIDLIRYVGGTGNARPRFSPAQIAHVMQVLDGIRFD